MFSVSPQKHTLCHTRWYTSGEWKERANTALLWHPCTPGYFLCQFCHQRGGLSQNGWDHTICPIYTCPYLQPCLSSVCLVSILYHLYPWQHLLSQVSSWRWKVYDHQTHDQMSLLDTMNVGCLGTSSEDCQGWIRYEKDSFPGVLTGHKVWCGWELKK